MPERVVEVARLMSADEATLLIGSPVGTDLAPTVTSPPAGGVTRVVCEGETVALITRLDPGLRAGLRHIVTSHRYGEDVGRLPKRVDGQQQQVMSMLGAVFGYTPAKVFVRQEGCRMTAFSRDDPAAQELLEQVAASLSAEFARLLPDQAEHDREVVHGGIHKDWRMGESNWTSGVINQANVLPYHRDGNNLDTWSAMPTLRYKMRGGYLHLPEYGLVFPCGDGDVTSFYGKGVVHGVTPMVRAAADAYRYSLVFYALKGMRNCATYAEETRKVWEKRTQRERDMAAQIRERAGQ